MVWYERLLGLALETREGIRTSREVLRKKKRVGLYFGIASEQCTKFTRELEFFYDSLKESDPDAFEVVFVTEDRDEESFFNHYARMPWAAVRFENIPSMALGEKYSILSLPAVVVVSGEDGSVIDRDAAQVILQSVDSPKFALTKWGLVTDLKVVSESVVDEINNLRMSSKLYSDAVLEITSKRIVFRTQKAQRDIEEAITALGGCSSSSENDVRLQNVSVSTYLEQAAMDHVK
jgi:hypothetical protein